MTKYIISPTPGGGSPTFPPAGGINAMNYCHGDGVTDDRAHILAAIAAAGANPVYFYDGDYYLASELVVPSGSDLVGESMTGAWLKGRVDISSNDTLTDLKIGDANKGALLAVNGATNSTMTRCHFRGGGGAAYTSVIDLGSPTSCSHLSFIDCEVERNLGSDPTFANGFNNVTIWVGHGWQVDDILFDGCTIGVSNGTATGSPRMGVECYVNDDAPRSYSNLTFRDTVIYGGDAETLDFSDRAGTRATGILVEGCTLHGGGRTKVKWGVTLNLECPLGAVIRNNTIGHYWGPAFQMTNRSGVGWAAPAATITGNTIDLTDGELTTNGNAPLVLWGDDNTFTGNNVVGFNWNTALFWLNACHSNTITGNTFETLLDQTLFWEMDGSSGNTLTPNTVT